LLKQLPILVWRVIDNLPRQCPAAEFPVEQNLKSTPLKILRRRLDIFTARE